jgi:hypothetical protein
VDACPKLCVRISLVPPIPPLSGNDLASVACSLENKVSLSGIGRLCVTTSIQRRRTSPQKEGTTAIHPCVSGLHSSVISFPYLYLAYLPMTCLLVLIGNSPSCTSGEITFYQALKLKKIKNWISAYSTPPLV